MSGNRIQNVPNDLRPEGYSFAAERPAFEGLVGELTTDAAALEVRVKGAAPRNKDRTHPRILSLIGLLGIVQHDVHDRLRRCSRNGNTSVANMSTPLEQDLSVPSSAEAQNLNAADVLGRMKEVYGVDTDTALADALHTTRQNVSKWRSRNSIPYAEAVAASYMRNVSIDYILTGRGSRERGQGAAPELDIKLLRAILLSLLAFDRIKIIGGDTVSELNEMAKAIAFQYKRAAEAAQHLQQNDGLDAEAARAVAVAATELISSDGTLFGPRLNPVDQSTDD